MPEIQKVTDPAKIVTDPLVLAALAEQGTDPEFVEFFQDYAPRSLGAEHSPYAKFYRDLKSGKRIMVVSGLPMVNHDGVLVHVGWEKTGNTYRTLPNQFVAQVTRSRVLLKCISDQPDGTKQNDQVEWEPQLFLNGVEQTCGKPVLLDLDPYNENYHQNVLEWDYGICKRRIRIIEGRFRERWLFESNPHGDIRIKHNFVGNLELRLGYSQDAEGKELLVRVTDDEEVVEASEFDKAVYPDEVIYPVEIGASATYYPDAHEETSTVDGHAGRYTTNELWPDITGNAGNQHHDEESWMVLVFIQTNTVQDRWWNNRRAIALFDATGLPATAEIDLAELDFYGRLAADGGHKTDTLGITPNANIYASTPASNIDLVNADYQELGSVAFCDTPLTYVGWSEGYNVFALNAAGIDAISKILMSKFGGQNVNYDVDQVTPAWSSSKISYLCAYPAEKGSGYKPKLVVTYHLVTEGSASASGIGLATSLGLLDVLGQPIGSGIGLATSVAKLDVFAQAQASGIGLATSQALLDVLAQAAASGIGLSLASGIREVLGLAPASGIGTGTSQALLDVLAGMNGHGIGLASAQALLDVFVQAEAEGIGLATSLGILDVLAQAEASGIGLGTADALLLVLAEAEGSGIGLGTTAPYLIIPASAYGSGDGIGLAQAFLVVSAQAGASGLGTGTVLFLVTGTGAGSGIGVASALALVNVLASTIGHGVGNGSTPRVIRIIRLIKRPPAVHDLGKTKPHYTLGKPQVDYTLGKMKVGSHNLGRRVN